MNKIAHALLVSSLAFTTSHAVALTADSPPNCTKEKCEVTISVGGNSCGGGISVSPDPVIARIDSGPIAISWKITGGWEFADNGIALATPGGDIRLGGRGSDRTSFTATNTARNRGSFKYDINLTRKVGSNPTETCSLDPTIVNK